MKLIPESWIGWWRLRGRRCPACGSKSLLPSHKTACRVCYGWAAKPKNRGRTPAADLVGNWRLRHADAKKSTPV